MKRTPVICAICFMVYAAHAQNLTDTLGLPGANSPQTHIKVNKQYDENGNLIAYDSVYTYSSSSDTSLSGFGDGFDSLFHGDEWNSWFLPHPNDSDFNSWMLNPFGNFHGNGIPADPFGRSLLDRPFPGSSQDLWDGFNSQMEDMMRLQQELMSKFFGDPPPPVDKGTEPEGEQNLKKKGTRL